MSKLFIILHFIIRKLDCQFNLYVYSKNSMNKNDFSNMPMGGVVEIVINLLK